MKNSGRIIGIILFVFPIICSCNNIFARTTVQIKITDGYAKIENDIFAIEFNLSDGTYSGIYKTDNTKIFKNAWYRIGQGGWKEPKYVYKAEDIGDIDDKLGAGEKLRVWYMPQNSYDPNRFLDISIYKDQPFFVILPWLILIGC